MGGSELGIGLGLTELGQLGLTVRF